MEGEEVFFLFLNRVFGEGNLGYPQFLEIHLLPSDLKCGLIKFFKREVDVMEGNIVEILIVREEGFNAPVEIHVESFEKKGKNNAILGKDYDKIDKILILSNDKKNISFPVENFEVQNCLKNKITKFFIQNENSELQKHIYLKIKNVFSKFCNNNFDPAIHPRNHEIMITIHDNDFPIGVFEIQVFFIKIYLINIFSKIYNIS